jgi:hypothetical protein
VMFVPHEPSVVYGSLEVIQAYIDRILAERDSLRAALEQEKDRYEVVREQVVGLLNDFMRQANDGITSITSSEKEKA